MSACLVIANVNGLQISTEKPDADPAIVLMVAEMAAQIAAEREEEIQRMMMDLFIYGSAMMAVTKDTLGFVPRADWLNEHHKA